MTAIANKILAGSIEITTNPITTEKITKKGTFPRKSTSLKPAQDLPKPAPNLPESALKLGEYIGKTIGTPNPLKNVGGFVYLSADLLDRRARVLWKIPVYLESLDGPGYLESCILKSLDL